MQGSQVSCVEALGPYGKEGAGTVSYWSGDLQGSSGQLMRQGTQRGCVNFLRPHSKLEGLRPEPKTPACPSLVLAGASGRGRKERMPLQF